MAKKKSSEIAKALSTRPADQRGAMWISSGSDVMDCVVGAGAGYGYSTGEVVIFEGDSSTGKTFLCHEIVAAGYYKAKADKEKPYIFEYMDCESGNTFDSKALYGVEIMSYDPKERVRPSTVQDAFAESMLFMKDVKPDGVGVLVLDSIDGLLSEEANERAEDRVNAHKRGRDFEAKSYNMEKSKYLSQEFMPKVADMAEKTDTLYIIVAQYREKPGIHGSIKQIGNGKALQYYAHKRVVFKVKQKIEENGKHIGNVLEVSTRKARGNQPHRSALFTIYFSTGIDNVASNLDYLYNFRTAEGKLSTASGRTTGVWEEGMEEMTRDELIDYVEENDLEAELTRRVHAKWSAGEEEAIAHLKKRKKRYG